MTAEILRRLFTIKQYHRMIETGILQEGDLVELIRGEIVEMAAIGAKHAAGVRRISAVLRAKLGQAVLVDTQNPVEIGEFSEPQPDISVLRARDDFYVWEHPKTEDVFLLIEVSDTTIRYDRTVKIPLYAEDRIAEVWIVDLNAEAIEVYRQPTPNGYQSVQSLQRGQTIRLLAFPNLAFSVDEILG